MPRTTVTITISNEFSDTTTPNPIFDVSVKDRFLTAGTVASNAKAVGSKTSFSNNGGIYESSGSDDALEGIVAYKLPGAKEVIAVYFSAERVTLKTFEDKGDLKIDENAVKKAANEPTKSETGTFTIKDVSYTYGIQVQTSMNGLVLQAKVNMTCSEEKTKGS